jgi:hypothetical protein
MEEGPTIAEWGQRVALVRYTAARLQLELAETMRRSREVQARARDAAGVDPQGVPADGSAPVALDATRTFRQ